MSQRLSTPDFDFHPVTRTLGSARVAGDLPEDLRGCYGEREELESRLRMPARAERRRPVERAAS